MMLADHGAEVIRVDRPSQGFTLADADTNVLNRSRRSIALDLKRPEAVEIVKDLCRTADGVVVGFRPGVMERLGLGPEVLLGVNPRLVYGRMTGWGQEGPGVLGAGHDINYIALAGALHTYGRKGERPTPPLNVVGDFGGGGMMLAFGMVSAILSARATGEGQVVDCAMVDGAAVLNSLVWSLYARGAWRDARGENFLDTGSHFYDTYETADGKYLAVGSIEPQFYQALLRQMGLQDSEVAKAQFDESRWPEFKALFDRVFKTRTRDEWCELMEQADACVTPVLSLAEAPQHPRNAERSVFVDVEGVVQPAPAPRYSRTPTERPRAPVKPGTHSAEVLSALGYPRDRAESLLADGVVIDASR
jgi:alpha-methylacyl-CoA racemase